VSVAGSDADGVALAPRTLPDALSDGEALAEADASADADGLAANVPPVAAPSATTARSRPRAGAASRGPRRGADRPEWDMQYLLSAARNSPVGRPPPDWPPFYSSMLGPTPPPNGRTLRLHATESRRRGRARRPDLGNASAL
jgi:hypothetical protein